jgi:hypothetical protein
MRESFDDVEINPACPKEEPMPRAACSCAMTLGKNSIAKALNYGPN